MLYRQVKPLCRYCPYYNGIDLNFRRLNGVNVNFMDIDLVGEIEKHIEFIAEVKHYRDANLYDEFYLPAHQYVCLKKVAKSLRCDLYFIVFDGFRYYITEIDRFSVKNAINHNGKKVVTFHKDEFKVFRNTNELDWFWLDTYRKRIRIRW